MFWIPIVATVATLSSLLPAALNPSFSPSVNPSTIGKVKYVGTTGLTPLDKLPKGDCEKNTDLDTVYCPLLDHNPDLNRTVTVIHYIHDDYTRKRIASLVPGTPAFNKAQRLHKIEAMIKDLFVLLSTPISEKDATV